MFETVSVDEAIRKGIRMVVYPRYAVFVIVTIISIIILVNYNLSGGYTIFMLIVGLVAGWLYWSMAATRWKLWAFDNVRNVHELQKRAVKEGIIGEDGGFWDSTTIRTSGDRQKWDALQPKFDVPDVFLDDYQVPAETKIFFSKAKTFLGTATGVIFFVAGVGLLVFEKEFVGIFLILMGLFFGYMQYREFSNNQPQIILNAEGIETSAATFCCWKDIAGEDVIVERSGKSSSRHFIYSYPEGSVDIDIDELAITHHELENLLRIYRGRCENKKG